MEKTKKFIFELFSFKGRVGRGRFILNGLAILGAALIITIPLDAFDIYSIMSKTANNIVTAYVYIWMIFAIPAQIFNCIKRLHDMDKPGTWWLLLFIPLVNFGLMLYLLIKRGTVGPNQYGESS